MVKDAPIWPEAGWWTNFKAPELPGLEDTASKQNLDIAVAAAQLLQAEATDEVAFSALLPTASINPTFRRTKNPGQSTGASNAVTAGKTLDNYNLSGSFSYGF